MDKIHIAIAVVGAVFFLWFAAPFAVGIFNMGNVTGAAVSALLIFYGIFYRRVHLFVGRLAGSRGGKIFLGITIAFAVCIVVIAAAETIGMVRTAFNHPPENTTAIVLGCKVNGTKPSRVLTERLEAAYAYLTENPKALCVLSGGQGEDESISEAECMYRYLTEKGIGEERLLLEDQSTTTEENLIFSMRILEEHDMDGPVTLVTSEFHEYRANETAKRLGITSYSTPSRTSILYLPMYYVRELYAILYYKMKV